MPDCSLYLLHHRRFGLKITMVKRAAIQALKLDGFTGLLSHLSVRLLGQPHFLVPASSIHFRNAGLTCTRTEFDFLHALLPGVESSQIEKALDFAKALPELNLSKEINLEFPERWNSGAGLQHVMAALVWLVKPDLVVETGTANGASALAISAAMSAIKLGKLISIDITKSDAILVPTHLREYIKFVQVDGSVENLKTVLQSEKQKSGISIFLHDADHSYLGQQSDYQVARDFAFDIIISDDVDTSLAFLDFAGQSGVVLYDVPKFIGGLSERKSLFS